MTRIKVEKNYNKLHKKIFKCIEMFVCQKDINKNEAEQLLIDIFNLEQTCVNLGTFLK